MRTRKAQAAPILLSDEGPDVVLERVTLGSSATDGGRREDFVQKLVFEHPDVIPMLDIEPAFTPLVSICRELRTPAGYLDNLWVTPEGGIILGECKLTRNPQARREVIAQALDYAQAIAGWHYSDLEAAISRTVSPAASSLWGAVSGMSELDEEQFLDAVERRLRTGRFLVLIIGDGIREGVEELAEYLQLHAGLHTGLALVDLSIWNDTLGQTLVVPRVPMKTVLIERGVVRIDQEQQIRIGAPVGNTSALKPRVFSLSETEFYDQLEQTNPEGSKKLKEFLSILAGVGIEAEFRKSLVLRFFPSPDGSASAGYITATGKFHPGDGWWSANKLGQTEIGQKYLEKLADLIEGGLRARDHNRAPFLVGRDGTGAKIEMLLDKLPEWADVTAELVTKLSEAASEG